MGRIVGLTGYAQSGKDTAAGFLIERGWTRLAFADILRTSLYNLNPIVRGIPGWDESESGLTQYAVVSGYKRVQEIVDAHGWDYAKTQYREIRELLQRFGTEVGRALYGENFWVEMAMRQIETAPSWQSTGGGGWEQHEDHIVGNWVITDVRFPNECDAVHNAGGQVYRIDRGNAAVNTHASEMHVASMPVDGVIANNGDLAAYEANVLAALGLPLN